MYVYIEEESCKSSSQTEQETGKIERSMENAEWFQWKLKKNLKWVKRAKEEASRKVNGIKNKTDYMIWDKIKIRIIFQAQEFLQHLNSGHVNVEFMMEEEKDGQLSFLDVLIIKK